MPCEVTNESYALLRHTRVSYAKRKISFKTEPGEKGCPILRKQSTVKPGYE